MNECRRCQKETRVWIYPLTEPKDQFPRTSRNASESVSYIPIPLCSVCEKDIRVADNYRPFYETVKLEEKNISYLKYLNDDEFIHFKNYVFRELKSSYTTLFVNLPIGLNRLNGYLLLENLRRNTKYEQSKRRSYYF